MPLIRRKHLFFATKSTLPGLPGNTLHGASSQRQRVTTRNSIGSNPAGFQFARRARMSSTDGHDTSIQAALALMEAAVSRPSPADRFNIDREGPAKRARTLRALEQRFQKLNEYCDETVAEIRASLERATSR